MKTENIFAHIYRDLKRYWRYLNYSSKCTLKSEVAGSRLNWLWWILDPLFYMMVYSFVSVIVFRTKQEYYPIYIMIGVVTWSFFNHVIMSSVTLVRSNSGVVSKIYVPKYIFLLQNLFVNLFKLIVSYSLIFIMMLLWRVPFTLNIFWLLPYTLLICMMAFGLGLFVMHVGVYVADMYNVMNVVMRLLFYFSGIFYNIRERVPSPFNLIICYGDPAAVVIDGLRRTVLYGNLPEFPIMFVWFALSTVLSLSGIALVYKYESSYAKVSQ